MALRFERTIQRLSPPWLQRRVGGALLAAIGEQLDDLVDRVSEGVRLRFPDDDPDHAQALARLGRDRRILRGPGEDAATYARRLRSWWDAHRTRGGPYAMLGQLYAFFLDWLNVRMDIVYHSGTRRWVDTDGTITRDAITWSVLPDGTEAWANIWVVYHLPETIPLATSYLVTSDGDRIVTAAGDPLVGSSTITPDEATEEELEIFRAIPRAWSAAHIPYVTVVLLYGLGRLWDYPDPVPTWDEEAATGRTWDADVPVITIAE